MVKGQTLLSFSSCYSRQVSLIFRKVAVVLLSANQRASLCDVTDDVNLAYKYLGARELSFILH